MFVLVMLIFYRTLIDQASSSDVWPILFGLAILQQAPYSLFIAVAGISHLLLSLFIYASFIISPRDSLSDTGGS